jgi:YhcH/YjgK/YiaL family protein
LWEAHRKYLDIHVILEGEELIEICDILNASVSKTYEEIGDYELFLAKKEQQIHLKKGCFLALFPNEVHKTSVVVGENKALAVKKIVFKIKL